MKFLAMKIIFGLSIFLGFSVLTNVAAQGLGLLATGHRLGQTIGNQINRFLPINIPLLNHLKPTPPPCALCALKNGGKCPNDIQKSTKASENVGQYQKYYNDPMSLSNNGFMDLIAGILRSVHTSTRADVERAKEKEAREKLIHSNFHHYYFS